MEAHTCHDKPFVGFINKKEEKNEKSEKHKNIVFLNVCCVMML